MTPYILPGLSRAWNPAIVRAGVMLVAICATLTGQPQALKPVAQVGFGSDTAADLWVHNGIAYVGTGSCGSGVKLVDVSNPEAPRMLEPLIASSASRHEDVVAIRAQTAAFRGDLLVAGLQQCRTTQPGQPAGARGIQFWDVTDPARPEVLGSLATPGSGAWGSGVHELYMFSRAGRVFVLLAVNLAELEGAGSDFRIVEATDPKHPVQIGEWSLRAGLGIEPKVLERGSNPGSYCHSVWANSEGSIAYLSYWDEGVILLDIASPEEPRFLGRIEYPPEEEGNSHSAFPTSDGKTLVITDEDFAPGGARIEITAPTSLAGVIPNAEGRLTRLLCTLGEVSGEVVYAANGCGNETAQLANGKIALLDAGGCLVRDKILAAQRAGAQAVIVIQDSATTQPFNIMGGSAEGIEIVGAMITHTDGSRLKQALAAAESVRVRLTAKPPFAWGYVRFFDISDPARAFPLATFEAPVTRQCPPPLAGTYSAHNPFLVADMAYVSWYAEGVRMLDISNPAAPVELASYKPPQNPNVWGVHVKDDVVFLSDINNGLLILRRVREHREPPRRHRKR